MDSAYPPIAIESDASLKFYKEVKAMDSNYMKFPVCTTIIDRREFSNNGLPASTQSRFFGETDSVNLQRLSAALLPDSDEPQFNLVDFASKAANLTVKDVDELMKSSTMLASQIDEVQNNEAGQPDVFALFRNEHILRRTIIFFSMRHKFGFRVVKSCGKQYFVACCDTNCGWFVKASNIGQSSIFMIRSLDTTHTCPIDKRMNEQRQVTAQVMSECIKRKYYDLKTIYTPADIIRDMKNEYGVDLSYKGLAGEKKCRGQS